MVPKLSCSQNGCMKNSTQALRYCQEDGRLYCKGHVNLQPKDQSHGKSSKIPIKWVFEENGEIKLKCDFVNCWSTKGIKVSQDGHRIECSIHRKKPAVDISPESSSQSYKPQVTKSIRSDQKGRKEKQDAPETSQWEALPVTAEFTLDELVGQIEAIAEGVDQVPNTSLRRFFKNAKLISTNHHVRGFSLADNANNSQFKESALIGFTADTDEEIFLNLYEPFCVATFGLQGSGKSHSLSVIVENCLLSTRNCAQKEDADIINLQTSMCCLVLHYDQSAQSVCEVTGLTKPRVGQTLCLPNDKMIVLVSPTYYHQRKAFYGPEVDVRPLLFKWKKMTADRLRKLMRLSSEDTQLYVATLLDILRSYQRLNRLPTFKDFINEVCSKADAKGQSAPLVQRLNILESFIHESTKNLAIQEFAIDISSAIKSGVLVVADISDPLLSREEASGVFELLVESFRTAPLTGCGKLLALDEAHKVSFSFDASL
jgi:hypothetical protein